MDRTHRFGRYLGDEAADWNLGHGSAEVLGLAHTGGCLDPESFDSVPRKS